MPIQCDGRQPDQPQAGTDAHVLIETICSKQPGVTNDEKKLHVSIINARYKTVDNICCIPYERGICLA
ncbi:MAG: hypothetical protein H7Y86_21695 [Rhizobacter sp.]|nr:hypothetical protein [Ferruginibacter sp.]